MNAEVLEALEVESRSLLAARHLLLNARRTNRPAYALQSYAVLATVADELAECAQALALELERGGHRPGKVKR